VRVLLDEQLPVELATELTGHEVQTVTGIGWQGLTNGEVLRQARIQFEAFVTMDRTLEFQQNLSAAGFGVVLIRARSNRMRDLRPLVPEILRALDGIKAGELRRVGA
jgi:predicted nuclease of predicted toxin-antitoxin system